MNSIPFAATNQHTANAAADRIRPAAAGAQPPRRAMAQPTRPTIRPARLNTMPVGVHQHIARPSKPRMNEKMPRPQERAARRIVP